MSEQPREFTTEDGSVYRGVPADEFPDFTDVDHRESLGLRSASKARSQNGLSANDRSLIASFLIPGSTRKLALRRGPMSVVLLDFFGFWHDQIEPIDVGVLDDWGYAERTIRGSSTTLSNHASGSAGDANALRHVLGKLPSASLTPTQIKRIRGRMPLYRGVARWGGDYSGRPDVMHAEGDDLRFLEQVAAQIQTGWLAPGVRSYLTGSSPTPGAPTPIPAPQEDDMFDPARDRATIEGTRWAVDQIKEQTDRLLDEDRQTDLMEWGLFDPEQGLRVQVASLQGQLAGLVAAVQQLGTGGGSLDMAAVVAAADRAATKAAADALGGLADRLRPAAT